MKNSLSPIIFLIVLFWQFSLLWAAPEDDALKKLKLIQEKQRYQVAATNHLERLPLDSLGLAQYQRSVVHEGNDVTGGSINAGLYSEAGNSTVPALGWPEGPLFSAYLWGAYFYAAAEVVDGNGDTTAIVSDHFPFGELAPDSSHRFHFQPLPGYFNLNEPGAQNPLIGGISEDVGIDGIPNTGDFGEGDGQLQPEEDFNANGILDINMINEIGWFATTRRKETWPTYWPAGSYPGDTRLPGNAFPGPRVGRWNGAYGAYPIAGEESYYLMDDRENDEFSYYPFNDPTPWPDGRQGLGLTVEVRNYQWSLRILEDALISSFTVTNNGKDLDKCVLGMMVDPDLGSFTADDGWIDTENQAVYIWDRIGFGPTGLPLGYMAVVILEGAGNPYDALDNDLDGMVDESLFNGIDDDGDWIPWEDSNNNGVWDTEDLNFNGMLDPGEDLNNNGILDYEPLNADVGSDGIGPDMSDLYRGPDPDGSEANGVPDVGEPDFEIRDHDESDQLGMTAAHMFSMQSEHANLSDDQHFWETHIQPGTYDSLPDWRADVAFTYGSGFAQLPENGKLRHIMAYVFGNDLDDLNDNIAAVRALYENDFIYTDSLLAVNAPRRAHPLKDFSLQQNYPNPFNPVTNIGFRTSSFGFVTLKIYDISGRLVKTLLKENRPPGRYMVQWDGSNRQGARVSSGVYFYSLNVSGITQTRKMILLR